MDKKLYCKVCGFERNPGRRLCADCNLKRHRQYPRYTWKKTCLACGEEYESLRKDGKFCKCCYNLQKELIKENIANNNYVKKNKTSKNLHREIAIESLGRNLKSDEVVHHLDCNHLNNEKSNLIVMKLNDHAKLHRYLNDQKLIIYKTIGAEYNEYWCRLLPVFTNTWIELTNAKILRLI